jgi:hypothetical protein
MMWSLRHRFHADERPEHDLEHEDAKVDKRIKNGELGILD